MLFVVLCVFIIRFYLKSWFNCTIPANDLNVIKDLILYKKEHSNISKAVIKKICNHLWYLTEETAALVFFDDTLPNEIILLMIPTSS